MGGGLVLRPPILADGERVEAVHAAVAEEGHEFLVGRRALPSWPAYLAWLDDLEQGRRLPMDWVPTTFRVAVVGDDVVGRATLRHRLTEHLASFGGHIGYVVAPDRRRRGHATAILRAALELAALRGIDRALLTIDEGNPASRRVAERCGAVLAGVAPSESGQPRMCRYWIPTDQE